VRHRARRVPGREGRRRARGVRDAPGREGARVGVVCLIEIHLHLPDNASLKGKRKEVVSLKAQLQRRFGAAVAETDHHDLWQRATLTAAIVGRTPSIVDDAAAKLERFVLSQFPDGVRFERGLVTTDEVLGA
jgi:uncharacterized protein YlxP (DUF503 family)